MSERQIKTNFQNWLEYDHNPFMLFGSKGEIITLNQSAQFLVSKVNHKSIYELTLSYASMGYGYKTSIVELKYDVFSFFAVTVGYEDESEIGIKLYQTPYISPKKVITIKDYELTNIYHLIDASIATVAARVNCSFRKEIDPTLPEFKLSQNEFVKILTRIYEGFMTSKTITTSLKLKTGEFLQLAGKRYPILQLQVSGESRQPQKDQQIEELSNNINVFCNFDDDKAVLNIPLVL